MAHNVEISRKRSLAKAVTWRIIGTTDTTILGWIFTGNPLTGLKIGFTEVITKTFLYYFHERAWTHVNLKKEHLSESRKRHLAKTITWRFVGTVDTVILAWIISGDPLVGLHVGGAELVTKMALYYLHERAWYRFNFGIKFRHQHAWDKAKLAKTKLLSRLNNGKMSKINTVRAAIRKLNRPSYDLSNTVLVVGGGRSGTTWLIEMMNAEREYRIVFEPFHRGHTNKLDTIEDVELNVTRMSSFRYKSTVESLLKGEIDSDWINRIESSNLRAKKQIVKEIRLNRIMPWIQENFAELKVIIIVRDPYSAAYSRAEDSWAKSGLTNKIPPKEFADEHFTNEQINTFTAAKSIFQRNLAIWSLENYMLLKHVKKTASIKSVYYENLVKNPETEFAGIAEFCGHTYKPLGEKVKKRSAVVHKNSVTDSSSSKFGRRWEGDITDADKRYATKVLKVFGLDTLYKDRNVPNFSEPLDWQQSAKK